MKTPIKKFILGFIVAWIITTIVRCMLDRCFSTGLDTFKQIFLKSIVPAVIIIIVLIATLRKNSEKDD